MNRDIRKTLAAAASATVSLYATTAMSQETAKESSVLPEVVVTAQFVEQNLQETPVAITAISSETLEARGHETVEQIAAQAPNVTLTTGGSFGGPSLVAFIRGVGQTDFNPAVEAGVGLYVDDVYYSTLTGSILDLLDLDRVEVLRGPQGTLAGKNSIGGSIKLYSKRPSAEQDGYAEVGYGSLNAVTVRAASNFTIAPDTLFARLAGVSRARDGYIERRDYGCTHPGSGFPSNVQSAGCVLGHEGGIKYTAVRGALRWLPNDALEINFAASFVNDVSEAPANTLLAVGSTVAPVIANGLIWDFPPLSSNVGCRFIAYGSNSCDPRSPNDPYVNYANYLDPRTGQYGPSSIDPKLTLESRDFALNIDWQMGDDMQLQSISAYRKYVSGWGIDSDGTPMPVLQLYQTLWHTQQSQELRLNGKWGGLLDYTFGGFYFDQETSEDGRINLGYVGFDFLHGPDPVDAPTWAIFTHGIVHAMDKMDVSLGARYSDEKKTYSYRRVNADGSAIQPCIGPPGTPGNPPNCIISSLNGTTSTFKDSRTDYRVALTYRWTDAFMTYAQISTGYKGGGVNPRPFYNVQAFTFEPEELTAYELGVKTQLFDDTMRLNAAVFSNKYKDIQMQLNNCTALVARITGNPSTTLGVPCLGIANAGDADVKGAELEFDWNLTSALQLDGSISYLDFKYTRVDSATGIGITTVDPTTGKRHDTVTPYTPEVKASIGVQYEIETGSAGSLTPRVDVSYQDDIYTAADNSHRGVIDSYTLVNASLTWRSSDTDWQASFECRNATDELYYLSKTDSIPGGGGVTYGAPALPRTYMVTIKRSF